MIASVLVDSLVYGSTLSFLAVGLTLTYITLKLANLAYGEFVVVGTYVVSSLILGMGFPLPISAYAASPLGFLAGSIVALASYLLIFRPLFRSSASPTTLLIASLALSIAIRGLLYVYTDVFFLTTNVDLYNIYWRQLDYTLLGLPARLYFIVGFVVLFNVVLYLLLTRTKFGVAMRASIENPGLASSLGIDVERVYLVAWMISGGLAGFAGSILPLHVIVSSPDAGWMLLLSIFAASIVGGLGSIYGSLIGGFLIGVAEIMGTYYLSLYMGFPPNLRLAIPFGLIIVTLLIVPSGLSGIMGRGKIGRRV